MFKNIFKSKVAITSVATFLIAAIGFITQLTHGIWGMIIPTNIILILTGAGVILSEIFNRFFPSGVWVGTGKDWTIQKYIGGIALIIISILQSQDVINVLPEGYGVVIAASIIPALQLIVRIFGGDTPAQVKASTKV